MFDPAYIAVAIRPSSYVHKVTSEVSYLSSDLIGPAKGFLKLLRNFHKILFSINQLLHHIFGIGGVFLASNSLHYL